MQTRQIRFTTSRCAFPFRGTATLLSGLFIYFINLLASYFPRLLFQTRYRRNCFAKQATRARPGTEEQSSSQTATAEGTDSFQLSFIRIGRFESANVRNAGMSL